MLRLKATITILSAGLLSTACTLAMMKQMSGPSEAKEPDHVDWPEAEALARPAAHDFANRYQGELMVYYLPRYGWNESFNESEGHHERSAGIWIYVRRKGGALVKGAEGEEGVCFQFNCSVVQQLLSGGWGQAFMACNEHDQEKVTCKSVENFARMGGPLPDEQDEQVTETQQNTPPPQPEEKVAAQQPPFGIYTGKMNATVLSGGKKQKNSAKGEITLIDLGKGMAEVVSGQCHLRAKRNGKKFRILPKQSCGQATVQTTDISGELRLMPKDQLRMSMNMVVDNNGQTMKMESTGVLTRKDN